MVVESPGSVVVGAPLRHLSVFSSFVELRSSLRCITFSPASSENVVHVNLGSESLELCEEVHAFRGSLSHVGSIKDAFVLLEFLIKVGVIEGVPVAHFDVGSSGVVVPVGDSISYGKTFEVWLEDRIVTCIIGVVLVNEVSHVGNVDSSIRFSGEVEIIGLEFGIFLEPGENDIEVILS